MIMSYLTSNSYQIPSLENKQANKQITETLGLKSQKYHSIKCMAIGYATKWMKESNE